jgi:hypothetical protein
MEALAEIVDVPGAGLIAVDSTDDLIRELDAIAERCRDEPSLVTVIRRDGDALSIGLGRPCSVLSFVASHRDPPYYASVGHAASDERRLWAPDPGGDHLTLAPQRTRLDSFLDAISARTVADD